MHSELDYLQFEFTPRQRHVLLPLVQSAQQRLRNQRVEAADEEQDAAQPVVPLDQLLGEAAKFIYHVTDERYRKISLSKPLLLLLLFELMQRLSPSTYDPTPAQGAEPDEQLRLYYLLSFRSTYHFAQQEYGGFIDQFRPAAELARQPQFPRSYVNTAGMNEVAVFTALYNAAKPQGRGFDQDNPRDITEEEGAALYYARTPEGHFAEEADSLKSVFGYVNGRLLKISRRGIERGYIDVTTYNKYNGEEAAQQAVAHLPRT